MNLTASSHETLIEAGFQPVCRTREVPGNVPFRVHIGAHGLLICRHRMRFYAVDEICPHRNSVMTHATVTGGRVQCPHHLFEFDLKTGECVRGKTTAIPRYDVEVAQGTVYVRLPAPPEPTQ